MEIPSLRRTVDAAGAIVMLPAAPFVGIVHGARRDLGRRGSDLLGRTTVAMLDAALQSPYTDKLLERTPEIVDRVAEHLLDDELIDRLLVRIEEAGVAEQVADRLLAHGIAEHIAVRVLDGPEMERIVVATLERPETQLMLTRIVGSPVIEATITQVPEVTVLIKITLWFCAVSVIEVAVVSKKEAAMITVLAVASVFLMIQR